MKEFKTNFFIIAFLSFGIFLGFAQIGPKDRNPHDSRKNESTSKRTPRDFTKHQSDIIGGNHQIFGVPYYTDNFDGANDTADLKARGYKVYYRGTGPQGLAATWFQGNSGVFTSFNGPADGYVAANFQVVTGANNIDSWLVLPKKSVTLGDSIIFQCRSVNDPTYPDSFRVMYSAVGDSTPEAGSWVELGRFRAWFATDDWERKGFRAPSTGANARYAIRYNMVDGGPLGANSNYAGVDALTLEAPPVANDIAALSIDNPPGSVSLPTAIIAPKATFGNVGTANQSNIPVTFIITGPVNYTNNKTITTLNAGNSIQVIFDSTFNPTVGTYNAVAYSSLAADGFRGNDTVKMTFRVVNPNNGSGAGYFYSNSITSGAPSKPTFCWKDTAGSKNLVLRKTIRDSANWFGTIDDGYFKIGLQSIIGTTKKIRFGGADYDSVFIGTNGLIGFTLADGGDFTSFSPDTGFVETPAFYPLWCDLNFNNSASDSNNRLSWRINDGFQLIVTWDRAPLFGGFADEYVSCQAVIDIVEQTYLQNSRLLTQIADATDGRTGAGYITLYNTNALPPVAVGLASTSTNKVFYRFSVGSDIVFPGPLFDGSSSLACQFGPDANTLNAACNVGFLQLTALFEGPYEWSQNFTDTVTVYLRKTSGNYEIVDGDSRVLNSSGVGNYSFSKLKSSSSYYIVVKSKAGIETWSANPVAIPIDGAGISYDFTTGINKAFGSNMRLVNTEACIYDGDVNQDGIIDGSDGAEVDNDIFNFEPGYIPTDLNWDGVVDGTDGIYTDNNAFNFIGVIRP